jgi:rare lipoprotein A
MRTPFLTAILVCLSVSPAPAFNASLYGGKNAQGADDGFHGKRTACGQIFDMHAMTAAHRTLPCGTMVKVTNKANGWSVIVTINDRGPAKRTGREIDLAQGAAFAIGIAGLGNVTLEVVGKTLGIEL